MFEKIQRRGIWYKWFTPWHVSALLLCLGHLRNVLSIIFIHIIVHTRERIRTINISTITSERLKWDITYCKCQKFWCPFEILFQINKDRESSLQLHSDLSCIFWGGKLVKQVVKKPLLTSCVLWNLARVARYFLLRHSERVYNHNKWGRENIS